MICNFIQQQLIIYQLFQVQLQTIINHAQQYIGLSITKINLIIYCGCLLAIIKFKSLIAKMIKCLYSKDLTFRLLFKNCINIYRNSQLYSTIKMGTSALKHSKFSEYMGLSSQLRKLQKEEQKTEKSQTRFNIVIITICLIGFSCAAVFIYGDASIRVKWSILTRKMQLDYYKDENIRKTIVQDMLNQVSTFLNEHPYEYLTIISSLNDILRESYKLSDNQFVEESLTSLFEFILQRNHKARSNKQFLQGVTTLLEHSVIHNKIIMNKTLLQLLLEQGSIKQMYLAFKCINHHQVDSSLKEKIRKNLQNQMEKSEKYFNTIFDSIKEQELPQISFKKAQTLKWHNQIRQLLN